MNNPATPSDGEPTAVQALASLLAHEGIAAGVAQRALDQLTLLSQSSAGATAIARAISVGPASGARSTSVGVGSATVSAARVWIERLVASIDEATDTIVHGIMNSPQPLVAGVRRASDPDRMRVARVIGRVSIDVDCERLPKSQGWRVLGHVACVEAPPPEIRVRLSGGASPITLLALDDLAMFECSLQPGTYALALVHEAQEAPLLADLVLP